MSDKFLVTATETGFLGGELRKPGCKFEVSDKQFSENWMKKGEYDAPKKPDNSKAKKAEDVQHEPLQHVAALKEKIEKKERKSKKKTKKESATE